MSDEQKRFVIVIVSDHTTPDGEHYGYSRMVVDGASFEVIENGDLYIFDEARNPNAVFSSGNWIVCVAYNAANMI